MVGMVVSRGMGREVNYVVNILVKMVLKMVVNMVVNVVVKVWDCCREYDGEQGEEKAVLFNVMDL